MSVFFKISSDGSCVYVAKTLISNEMKEEEFNKKASRLTIDQFLSKFPKVISEKLEANINRVKEIEEMKLSLISKESYSNPVTRTTRVIYTVGNRKFAEDCGEEEECHEFQDAIEYGKELYGEEIMNESLQKLKTGTKAIYFARAKEISKEKYTSLLEEKEKLTNIVCLQKQNKKTAKM